MKKILILLIAIIAIAIIYRTSRKNGAPVPETTPAVATDTPKAIPQKEAISGSTLNKVFPTADGEYKVTFTQEKDGFAQANLTKGSAKVAALTVSDTDANPTARDKFKNATHKIAGLPAAAVGSQGTAVLAGDRYQVQVRSLTPSFTESDREAWIGKFKLDALAAVHK